MTHPRQPLNIIGHISERLLEESIQVVPDQETGPVISDNEDRDGNGTYQCGAYTILSN